MIVTTPVNNVANPCSNPSDMASISFTNRLMLSSCGWLSWYFSGSTFSLSNISLRKSFTVWLASRFLRYVNNQPNKPPMRYTRLSCINSLKISANSTAPLPTIWSIVIPIINGPIKLEATLIIALMKAQIVYLATNCISNLLRSVLTQLTIFLFLRVLG